MFIQIIITVLLLLYYPSLLLNHQLTAADGIKHYVFLCVYRIFSIVRPRKLLYMAIDGVVWMMNFLLIYFSGMNFFHPKSYAKNHFVYFRLPEQKWINRGRVDSEHPRNLSKNNVLVLINVSNYCIWEAQITNLYWIFLRLSCSDMLQ